VSVAVAVAARRAYIDQNHYELNDHMATVVTINRPDVVALIERAADRLTNGNKTEAVHLAVRRLLER
jgi:hypothetical protein